MSLESTGYRLEGSSCITGPDVAMSVIAVLVHKLGGDVTITQTDLDAIAERGLLEGMTPEGTLRFAFEELVKIRNAH